MRLKKRTVRVYFGRNGNVISQYQTGEGYAMNPGPQLMRPHRSHVTTQQNGDQLGEESWLSVENLAESAWWYPRR